MWNFEGSHFKTQPCRSTSQYMLYHTVYMCNLKEQQLISNSTQCFKLSDPCPTLPSEFGQHEGFALPWLKYSANLELSRIVAVSPSTTFISPCYNCELLTVNLHKQDTKKFKNNCSAIEFNIYILLLPRLIQDKTFDIFHLNQTKDY